MLTEQFLAARRAGVPIVVVRTADQIVAVEALTKCLGDKDGKAIAIQWDAAAGLTGLTDHGRTARATLKGSSEGFVEAVIAVRALKAGAVVFAMNAHRQLQSSEPMAIAAAIQAVANLRDAYKLDFRTLVLLGPSFTIPPELEQDVIVLDDALPDLEALKATVVSLYKAAKQEVPEDGTLDRAAEAVSGLSAFAAEQVTAMSFSTAGLNLDSMWERKRIAIEQTRGLSVYRGGDTFDDLRGLDSVKRKLRARLKAKTPVGVVCWIDEGADIFANIESDTTGVKMDQQRALLVEMENNGWRGVILTGVAGTGKSAIARAFGNEAGVPTIALDFGDMESKYVGDSEANMRQAIRTIKAVGRGHAFFVLTCNSLAGIRPQFMRRYKKGVFFFDLLSAEEQRPIWDLYMQKFELPAQPLPPCEGWTGAEIRECCEEAWDTGVTLLDAARYIIPVSRSRADVIERMRKDAHGRFLDANREGVYKYDAEPMQQQVRAITLPDAILAAGLARAIPKES